MVRATKGYIGLPLEGYLARWYARITRGSMDDYRKGAADVNARVAAGAKVLEVAPGPGYLSIELARFGRCHVVGLDISHSFVAMATESARQAGVTAEFHQGDAAAMPFADNEFDFIICRAAFKNFSRPVEALDEMHRVLRPGGQAWIVDLSKDASQDDINACVADMNLGRANSAIVRWTFKHMLLKRAKSRTEFERLARESAFGSCQIEAESIGFNVWLTRPAA
ncbi:MAG TPA: class I SAM-dependent methyltransferase [Pirellulales bacterium]|nr:class I SAM-dependent methyltransferase [Pirellulales bacterium]